VWIVSRLNAFGLVFLAGLFAGFALGTHAVMGANAPATSMAAFTAIGAVLGVVAARRFDRAGRGREACPRPDRGCDPSCPRIDPPLPRIEPVAPRAGPASAGIENAQAALVGLGFKARDARKAVVSAIATLDADADVAAIIKAALRASRP
jgi:hypothetical protein